MLIFIRFIAGKTSEKRDENISFQFHSLTFSDKSFQ